MVWCRTNWTGFFFPRGNPPGRVFCRPFSSPFCRKRRSKHRGRWEGFGRSVCLGTNGQERRLYQHVAVDGSHTPPRTALLRISCLGMRLRPFFHRNRSRNDKWMAYGVHLCTSLYSFPCVYWHLLARLHVRLQANSLIRFLSTSKDLIRPVHSLLSGVFISRPTPDHAHPSSWQRRQRARPRLETLPVGRSNRYLPRPGQWRVVSREKNDQRRPQHRGFPRTRQVRSGKRGAATFPPPSTTLILIRLIS